MGAMTSRQSKAPFTVGYANLRAMMAISASAALPAADDYSRRTCRTIGTRVRFDAARVFSSTAR